MKRTSQIRNALKDGIVKAPYQDVKDARAKRKAARAKRKAERLTVRELIELLAKGDWDSEVTCISNRESESQFRNNTQLRKKISGISHNATIGTQILFDDNE